MTVTPHNDELFVYDVSSDTEPGESAYRVDLLAFNGIGQCACMNWQTRIWNRIKAGERAKCKHVVAAMLWQMDRILIDQSKNETSRNRISSE